MGETHLAEKESPDVDAQFFESIVSCKEFAFPVDTMAEENKIVKLVTFKIRYSGSVMEYHIDFLRFADVAVTTKNIAEEKKISESMLLKRNIQTLVCSFPEI